jgi:hypothetical protein
MTDEKFEKWKGAAMIPSETRLPRLLPMDLQRIFSLRKMETLLTKKGAFSDAEIVAEELDSHHACLHEACFWLGLQV